MVWYGSIWSCMVSCGPLWFLMFPYRPLCSIMVPFGHIWPCIAPFAPVWSHMVLHAWYGLICSCIAQITSQDLICFLSQHIFAFVQLTQLLHKFCACFKITSWIAINIAPVEKQTIPNSVLWRKISSDVVFSFQQDNSQDLLKQALVECAGHVQRGHALQHPHWHAGEPCGGSGWVCCSYKL